MSTSERDDRRFAARRGLIKTAAAYIGAALLCVLFNTVYGLFSHGVHSTAMALAFLCPLAAAALYALLALLWPQAPRRPLWGAASTLFGFGTAALTLCAALTGVLEIAGASSPWLVWFAAAGGASAAVSPFLLLHRK